MGICGSPADRGLLGLRPVLRHPLLDCADLLYFRIPAMLGVGSRCPLPFAVEHYRPWPDLLPALRPLCRRTARRPDCLGFILHSDHAADAATLAQWLAAADVLGIPPSRAPLERFGDCVLPIKTYAYLPAGRPILAPAAPDTAELPRDGETASLVPPDQPEAAALAPDRLLRDGALARRLAGNGRALAAELSWDSRAAKIAAFLGERLKAR